MKFVDVVVNVPIGRGYARPRVPAAPLSETDPFTPDALPPIDEAEGEREDPAPYQTFTYHLPVDLEDHVQPGHLVWVPFGKRTIQGIVVRSSDSTEIHTRAVLRLARPEPVLTAHQIELAAWIANDYVAPIAETVRLLLPPGLLKKSPESLGVQAKRQLQVAVNADRKQVEAGLESMGKDASPIGRALKWFLDHLGQSTDVKTLRTEARLTSAKPIEEMRSAGWVTGDERLTLALERADALRELEKVRGIARYREIVDAFSAQGGGPFWRDEANEIIHTPLATLREMQDAGILSLAERVRFRDPLQGRTFARTRAPKLTSEQIAAWETLRSRGFEATEPGAKRFLLHGVTGSGKTEIYLRSIAATLAQGKQAIVLVPEIALTPQTLARFGSRFPGRVTVIHSGLSNGERYDVWRALRAGEYDIVIGARSALFAPMPRLGLIVIDEEHESSYKQNSEEWGSLSVFYDARRVAVRLAELTGSVLIAGSATPSLEIYTEAMDERVTLIRLPRRVEGHVPVLDGEGARGNEEEESTSRPTVYAAMPPVEVVDMRQELRVGHRSIFSRTLQSELQATFEANEQAILFLNRRGTHTFIMCRDCGFVVSCPNCEVPLVYHVTTQQLACHHCGNHFPVPEECPQCHSRRIKFFGSGTEQIEQRVAEIVPRARIERWDADTTTHKGSHEAILQRFSDHQADILVGTQMIAKGLDLPLVTLVGVVAADVGLHLPDFRAAERTFQLLTQVAGRAGRSRRGGRVVIQSYTPEHYAIQAAAEHDYEGFYSREMLFREQNGYPPVRRMARLVLWEKKPDKAQKAAKIMARTLKETINALGIADPTGLKGARIIGPAPAFFARIRGFYRWQILLLAEDPAAIVRTIDIPFGWRVDIDPTSVL